MYWLIAGLVIFFGVHIFSSFRAAREKMIQRLGENRYKAGYALLAVAGFILIVIGVGKAEAVPLWEPVVWVVSPRYGSCRSPLFRWRQRSSRATSNALLRTP